MADAPFFIPPPQQLLPKEPFENIIGRIGVRLVWQKSHLCPCTYGGSLPGSPDPQCVTCSGRGTYWDPPGCGPFQGLITFMHLSPSPDEPGTIMDAKFGMIQRGEPALTIPYSAGRPWAEASINDLFIEIDAIDRFNAELQVGGVTTVPYQERLSIKKTGAVTVWDPTTKAVVPVSGYTVSGATVTLPSGYATSTPYVVEFNAAKAYVAWRESGSLPHDRPFGQINEPKRFRLQQLDLWLRGQARGV